MTVVLYLRVSEETKEQLADLCAQTVRQQNDMVTYLIQEAHREVFGPQSEHSTTETQTGI
jgi:hypothetical protein